MVERTLVWMYDQIDHVLLGIMFFVVVLREACTAAGDLEGLLLSRAASGFRESKARQAHNNLCPNLVFVGDQQFSNYMPQRTRTVCFFLLSSKVILWRHSLMYVSNSHLRGWWMLIQQTTTIICGQHKIERGAYSIKHIVYTMYIYIYIYTYK